MRSKEALHTQAMNTGMTSEAVLSAAENGQADGVDGPPRKSVSQKCQQGHCACANGKKDDAIGVGCFGRSHHGQG